MKQKKIPFGTKLHQETIDKIKALANEHNASQAEIIKTAIDFYVHFYQEIPFPETNPFIIKSLSGNQKA